MRGKNKKAILFLVSSCFLNSKWMNEWMNEWLTDWLTEWMNEWMNEWVNEWMNFIQVSEYLDKDDIQNGK